MTRQLLAAAILASCSPLASPLALADTFRVPAAISGVDIYPDGAILERVASLDLAEGTHTLILTDLPQNWDAQTLGLTPSPTMELVSVTMQMGAERPHVRARLDQIAARKAEITESLKEVSAAYATAQAEFTMVERFMNAPDLFSAREDAAAFWAYLISRHSALSPELAIFDQRRTDLLDEREALIHEASELQPQLTTWQIKADVGVLSDGPQTLHATYYTPQASWRTSYDLSLDAAPDAATGLVTIDHGADIYQNTGEDWQDVPARLHSTIAQRPIYAPTLFTWHLGPVHKGKGMGPSATMSDEMALMAEPSLDMAQIQRRDQAAISQSAYHAVYRLTAPLTLASTNHETQRVLLESRQQPADLWAQTTAETSDQATLMAGVQDTLRALGLPGPAKFYRNGSLIGRGQIGPFIPGAAMEIPFGIDPFIAVSRLVDGDQAGDGGFIGRTQTLTRTVITQITNHHAFAMPLRVLEAAPVPLHEDIEVSTLRGSNPFDLRDFGGQKGLMAWTPVVEPGAQIDLTFGYQVVWPADMNIGL